MTSIETATSDSALSTNLQAALGLPAPVDIAIDPNDQMFTFIASTRGSDALGRSDYLTSGAQLLKILEQLVVWKFGSFKNVSALLDFASGFGRLTRFLIEKLPPDRVWVSDIQADAVAFQEAQFGVHGYVSTADPDALICDQQFDCIFVASLFSHLPPTSFTRWLKKLSSFLKPGGLLAFTVHDATRLPAGETMPDSGIWFSAASEIGSIDAKDYGDAIVTEDYVRQAIVAATGRPTYQRIPLGLLFHQDIYLVVNDTSADFSDFHFAYLPHGVIDYALWLKPGELYVRGWAADMAGADAPLGIRVYIDGQLRKECVPSHPRPDVSFHYGRKNFLMSGWDCSFPVPDSDPSHFITVKARSTAGIEALLYVGPIASLLPAGKAESCLWVAPDELYVRGWAVDMLGMASPVQVQVSVEGQLVETCSPFIYRPELRKHFDDDRFLRSGWECLLNLPNGDPTQMLEVKSLLGSGIESILYKGPISFLEAQGSTALSQERMDLITLDADLQNRLEYIHHLEAEIGRKNAAIADLESRLRRRPWQRR